MMVKDLTSNCPLAQSAFSPLLSAAWLKIAVSIASAATMRSSPTLCTWSNETYRIFGLTPQEGPIDLDKVPEMTHPDDRKMVFRNAEHAADVVLILPARVDSRGRRIILG